MTIVCPLCKQLFSCRQSLYRHRLRFHKMQNLNQLVEQYPTLYTQMGGRYFCCGTEITNYDFRFKHPTTIMVAAPTKAGKTTLVTRIVDSVEQLFTPKPEQIIWCYNEHQSTYNLPNVNYVQGLPEFELLKTLQPKLLILDDMMAELDTNPQLLSLFTRGCHHWNCSIIHIVQDIFFNKKRTNRINTQYIFLLKSPGDKLTAMNIAKQMFPTNTRYFMKAYNDATEKPHGYLLLDLEQSTPEHLRLRTDIFPNETMSCWVEANKKE